MALNDLTACFKLVVRVSVIITIGVLLVFVIAFVMRARSVLARQKRAKRINNESVELQKAANVLTQQKLAYMQKSRSDRSIVS